jgi:CRP-like cAMP-binding protein
LGTLGDKFYVILKGEVGVHIYQQISVPEENSTKCKIENRLILINTLLTGDSFGELALLGV